MFALLNGSLSSIYSQPTTLKKKFKPLHLSWLQGKWK